MIHPTPKVSKGANRKLGARNILVLLLTPYTDLGATTHSYRRTDRWMISRCH